MASLRDKLEEKFADINPFDGGRTAQTVRKQRRQAQPAQTVRRPKKQESTADKLQRWGTGVGLSAVRSVTGLAQGASGLYDLATPGRGTNRASKSLDRFAKFTDQTAKAEGVGNVAYRGGQVVTDLLSFGGTGKIINAAAKLPTIARGVRAVSNVTRPVTNRVTNAATRLSTRGAAGRVAAAGLTGLRPAGLANAAVNTAIDLGMESGKGRDISPQTFAVSAGLNTGLSAGLPAGAQVLREAGRVAAPAIRRGTQAAADTVRTIDEKAFSTRVRPDDQAALRSMSDYLASVSDETGRDLSATIANARQAAARYGVDISQGTRAEQLEAVNMILDQVGRPNKAVSQGGYVKVPELNPNSANKQRGFVKSVKSSDEVSVDTKRRTTGSYEVRNTNKLQQASEQYVANTDSTTLRNDLKKRLEVPARKINDKDVSDTIAAAKKLDAEGDFDGASGLYEKLAEHLTALGQSVQAASLLARRTPEGILFQAQKTLTKAGKKLNDEQNTKLKELLDAVRKTDPESPQRLRATYDVTKFVNDQVPSSRADRLINIWRAGLLTAPTTTAGNLTGNLGEAITRKAFVNPVSTAADAAIGLFTGKRTQTLAPLGSGLKGAKEGAEKLPDYIRTGFDERNALNKYDNKPVSYGDSPAGRAASYYVNGVYRLMGTADQPFYYSAHKNAIGSLAKAEAINQGLKGADRKKFVDNFIENPPQEAVERAAQEAAFATFQNKTRLGGAAMAAKDGLNKVAPGLGDFIIPFTQVPASIATRIVTRTPVGTAIEMVRQIRKVRSGGGFDQRAMAQSIGEGAFGAAVLGAGYSLANSGLMTFGYPADARERALWESEGKQPYSVKVGNRWYSLNYIQPFGAFLAVGAKVGEELEAGKSWSDAIATGVATAGQSIANQSFVKGISGAIDTITDPERSATKFVNQTGQSIVPNFIRSGARAIDPLQREPAGFVQGVQQGVPFLRENTPAKIDVFGQELTAKDNPLNQFLNPLRPSIDKSGDIVLGEARRLQDLDIGVLPSQIKKDTFGEGSELTDQQMRELQSSIGASVNDAWGKLIETERYAQLNDKEKASALKRLSSDILAVEKQRYAAENLLGQYSQGYDGPSNKLSSAQSAILNNNFDPEVYARPEGSKSITLLKGDDRGTALLDKVGTFNKDQRSEWEDSDFDTKYKDLYDRAQGIRFGDLPALPQNNKVLGLYADFIKERAKGMTPLKQNQAKLKFLKEAYKTELSTETRELLSASATDILDGVGAGYITPEQVAEAIEYDNILLNTGLNSSADISNSVREALGFDDAPESKRSRKSGKKSKKQKVYSLYGSDSSVGTNKSLRQLLKNATLS